MDAITALWAHIALDWIILAAVAIVLTIDSLRSGPSRAIALSLAFPLAAFLFPWLASTTVIGRIVAQMTSPMLQAALFIALVIVLFLITYRFVRTYDVSERPLQALFTGIATAAVMTVVWIHTPALTALWHLSTQATSVFGASYGLLWIVAALFVLATARA